MSTKKKATKKPAIVAWIKLETAKSEAVLELNKREFDALIDDSHEMTLGGCELAGRIWEELFCAVGVGQPIETIQAFTVEVIGSGDLEQKLLQALANLNVTVEEM